MAEQVVAMILAAALVFVLIGHLQITDFVMLLLLSYPLLRIMKMQ